MAAGSQQRESSSLCSDAAVPSAYPANVQAWFNAYGNQTFNFLSTAPRRLKSNPLRRFYGPATTGCDDSSTPSPQPVPFVGVQAGIRRINVGWA